MASEWLRLYPNAKLLVARPEDFTKDNRQKFTARCVTGEYDAVVMSFTQFEKIPMSNEYRKQFMEKELNEILDALNEVDSTDRVSVKSLERQKRQIEERLEKLTSGKRIIHSALKSWALTILWWTNFTITRTALLQLKCPMWLAFRQRRRRSLRIC